MIELLFGEAVGRESRLSLLDEAGSCEACFEELCATDAALQMFDDAAEAALPEESFWTGYEERLRMRMAQVLPLNGFSKTAAGSYQQARTDYYLTILIDEGLLRRLSRELREVARDSRLTWPSFKAEPFQFTRRFVRAYAEFTWTFLSQRNVALATLSSFVVVCTLIAGVIGLERLRISYMATGGEKGNDYELIGMVPANVAVPEEREEAAAGSPGRATGKGGGMLPHQAKPHGGGGGGNNEAKPASHGKTPPGILQDQIVPPDPYPPKVKNPELPVVPHLNADGVLFPPDYSKLPYGDPRSKSTETSAGPGSNGGIGEGTDGGIGEGRGDGYGPGEDGNTGGGKRKIGGGGPGGPDGVGGRERNNNSGPFTAREVTRKALITSKPEPGFSEEARKNNAQGTVKLRLALRADGTVGDVSVIKGLPFGLTERAIQAAKRIQFVPAQREGRNVSQWITIEYNFNIY